MPVTNKTIADATWLTIPDVVPFDPATGAYLTPDITYADATPGTNLARYQQVTGTIADSSGNMTLTAAATAFCRERLSSYKFGAGGRIKNITLPASCDNGDYVNIKFGAPSGNLLTGYGLGVIRTAGAWNICTVKNTTITDTGIGMSPEELSKLFKPFSQADSSITRNYGGSGLGLSISKQLVERMGGEIWVESKKGTGTKFCFKLQFGQPTTQIQLAPPLVPANSSLSLDEILMNSRPLNILLVDDNEDNRTLILSYLKKSPFKIDVAENGKIALDQVQTGKAYDLIFMDMQMPIMDGLTATQLIRKWEIQNSKKPVPILALTANALKEEVKRSLEAGCNAHLAKPIKKIILLKAVIEYTD